MASHSYEDMEFALKTLSGSEGSWDNTIMLTGRIMVWKTKACHDARMEYGFFRMEARRCGFSEYFQLIFVNGMA